MNPIIISYLEQTAILLKHAPDEHKGNITAFLHQLHKLKDIHPDLINNQDGNQLLNLMKRCFNSINKTVIDNEEIFAQLLPFMIKSVLITNKNSKLNNKVLLPSDNYRYN